MNDPGRGISRKSPSLYIVFVPKLTKRAYTVCRPARAANFTASPGALALFSLLGMAGYGVILWLLHRCRRRLHAGAGTAFPCRCPPRSPDNLLGRDVPAK